jgi:hypothetical protein
LQESNRIEYALLLPTLNDFLEGRENLEEDLQLAYSDFITSQHRLSSMITSDGDLKQGRDSSELEDETNTYKNYARDLIRVMKKYRDFFAPLIQHAGDMGGSAVRLVSVMKDLNDMMDMTFSTPVESDNKQKHMLDEITQRKKKSREFIEHLSTRLLTATQDRDKKVRGREDQLDEIKQALQQALANDDLMLPDDMQGTEERLKSPKCATSWPHCRRRTQRRRQSSTGRCGRRRRRCRC